MDKNNIQTKKVLFTSTVDSHIMHFHIPYLKMYKDAGYEVHVATSENGDIPFCDKKHVVPFKRNPFKTKNINAFIQLKSIIMKEKFEIIHCHTPVGGVVTRLAAKKARKLFNTKVFYTAHGFHFYKGAPCINWLLYYTAEKYLACYTDTIITINEEDYSIAKKKFTNTQIEYVHGVGVDEKKFTTKISNQEKDNLRKELNISKDDIVLIYTAELNKNKNQKMIIEVMNVLCKQNANYKLLLVGKDSFNGKHQELVKRLKLDKNIYFLGYRTDIYKLLQIANIAVSTSKREGLPLNIVEAQLSGLPCIVTDCRGNRDLVNANNLVKIGDIQGMAKKILETTTSNSKDMSIYYLENVLREYEQIYGLKIREN